MKKAWIAVSMAILLLLTACSDRSVSGQGENMVASEGMGQGTRSGVQEKAEYGELPVYEYQQKEISVTNDGKKIYGVVDMMDYDVYEEIGSYEKKVLLMHGSADSIVPISYSERAAEVYEDVDYHVMDGAGHGFRGTAYEQSLLYIFDYLQEIGALKSPGEP
ncbi:MAG: hypothetical protein NC548_42425 [Lachnospiraceae bacterium]|nr:hypothetical protein [Acetatifactor muris]MCM1221159.1 hypothetical protein [Lachnospiraceae bacterium]